MSDRDGLAKWMNGMTISTLHGMTSKGVEWGVTRLDWTQYKNKLKCVCSGINSWKSYCMFYLTIQMKKTYIKQMVIMIMYMFWHGHESKGERTIEWINKMWFSNIQCKHKWMGNCVTSGEILHNNIYMQVSRRNAKITRSPPCEKNWKCTLS